MRPTCTFCARKHLGQAIVLLGEAVNGYPDHLWLALGHLAEASEELNAFPELAAEIRGYRKQLEVAVPPALPFVPLMEMIARISKLDVPSPHPNQYATIGRADHSKHLDTGPHHYEVTHDPTNDRSWSAPGAPAPELTTPAKDSDAYGIKAGAERDIEEYARREKAEMRRGAPVALAIGELADEIRQERRGHHMAPGGIAPIPVGPPAPLDPRIAAAIEAAKARHAVNPLALPPGVDPVRITATPVTNSISTAPPPPRSGAPAEPRCLVCEDKAHLRNLAQQLLTERPAGGGAFRGRLVIMTTLANFARSYSLSAVTLEQAHAAAIAGYRVIILVYRGCDMKDCPALPPEISVLPIVPALGWKQDVVDQAKAEELTTAMTSWMSALGVAMPGGQSLHIITHDLLFQSHFVTFAAAIHAFQEHVDNGKAPSDMSHARWWHMAHSSVGSRPHITAIPLSAALQANHGVVDARHWRCTLPKGHQLIVLNYADFNHFADYYHDTDDQPLPRVDSGRTPQRIHVLTNPRDIRPFLSMTPTAAMLTSRYRLHLVDVMMLYPLSLDRVKEKGVRHVLQLLGAMKRSGLSVRLLIAAAHAHGNDDKAAWVQEQARAAGLITHGDTMPARAVDGGTDIDTSTRHYPDDQLEVILTSEAIADKRIKAHGLPPEDISALFHVSNLFVFPTISEAGPLVLMEAALAGVTLVLNQSLPCLRDYIDPDGAIWVPWGSLKAHGNAPEGQALDALVKHVWTRMHADRAAVTKRRVMQAHCLETYGERLVQILEGDREDAAAYAPEDRGAHPEDMGDLPFVEPSGKHPYEENP